MTTTRPIPAAAGAGTRAERKRKRRAKGWRPWLRAGHKWVSLVTGLSLLVVVMSGVALLPAPELDQLTKPELYRATPSSEPISLSQAVGIVNREHPDFQATTGVHNRGIIAVYDKDFARFAHVDPGTGKLLGTRDPNHGVIGFLKNLHMCLLSCPEYTGHVPFMAEHVGLKWAHEGEQLTVAGAVLTVTGIVLVLLCVSGLVLWWPGVKRFFSRGFQIRRGAGRYKRDYDLHKLVGFAALPMLLMWAVTGVGFELRALGDVWYALLPGSAPAEAKPFESAKAPGRPDIGVRAAERVAVERVGRGARVTSVGVPAAKEPAAYYNVWVTHRPIDPYRYGDWPGELEVAVDRKNPRHTAILYGDPAVVDKLGEQLWEEGSFPMHAGTFVGWIPRMLWAVFGVVPLLLAFTGVSMVLVKRAKKRARRRRRPLGPAPPRADDAAAP